LIESLAVDFDYYIDQTLALRVLGDLVGKISADPNNSHKPKSSV
jgi:hypothetical protein